MKGRPVAQIRMTRADVIRFRRIRFGSVPNAAGPDAGARLPTGTAFRAVQDRSEVVWVYAVAARLDRAKLPGLTGVAGEPVRLVTEGSLSAVVGSVSDTSFGEKTLPSFLADLSAIEAVGRAHHRVISSVAGDGPVLPLRLATVYPDDETITALLARRYVELSALLESFRGTQEWDVKVYLRPQQDAGDQLWLDLTGTGAGQTGADQTVTGPGQVCDEIPPWTTLEACAEDIGRKLSRIAVATRRRPSSLPSLADDSGWMVLNSAYLVDTEHASRFSEIVTSATAGHTALRAVVTGPWPPYSFADR